MARSVLAPIVAGLLRALARSWRVRFEGPSPFPGVPPPSFLGVAWHSSLLISAGIFRDSGIHVPVSRSRDGENITAVMQYLGLGPPPRGSSSRAGISALLSMVRILRAGGAVGMFADGPRGPARVAKPGVVALARLSRSAVQPAGMSARPCVRFNSWDRMMLPLPFARVVCRFAEPLPIAFDSELAEDEPARNALEATLNRLTDEVEASLLGAGV
ncbi:MAG: DUF374 domain-containing protein [Myxococcales bacterium]|nr:DUF374 domain-containing protein [Myxococcales bacterium]